MTDISFRKLKKVVPDGNNGWEERIFYMSTLDNSSYFRIAKDWLTEKYGDPKYCSTWWAVSNTVVMSEKIYTHYALSV